MKKEQGTYLLKAQVVLDSRGSVEDQGVRCDNQDKAVQRLQTGRCETVTRKDQLLGKSCFSSSRTPSQNDSPNTGTRQVD